ncbi:hypothetical protein ABZU25_22670 [Micromonospora sp. NPDC005215]|uniref:hypothetical protein n=1 Tax=Micromonospora sp. NPDC005215 TaxID=3157024 RepID=UPI0033BA192D
MLYAHACETDKRLRLLVWVGDAAGGRLGPVEVPGTGHHLGQGRQRPCLPVQQQRIGYVLAVPRNQRVPTTVGNSRPDVLAANAPALAWKRRSCGDGAKGPRLYDWAVASLPGTATATGC